MDGVKRHCPDMAPWAYWCLNGSSRVYYNARVINCTWAMPLHPIHARTPRDAVICVENVNRQQHFVIRQFVQPRPYAQDGRLYHPLYVTGICGRIWAAHCPSKRPTRSTVPSAECGKPPPKSRLLQYLTQSRRSNSSAQPLAPAELSTFYRR